MAVQQYYDEYLKINSNSDFRYYNFTILRTGASARTGRDSDL